MTIRPLTTGARRERRSPWSAPSPDPVRAGAWFIAEQGEQYRRAWLDRQSASDKQIGYVRARGYSGGVTSKAHGSALIDPLLQRREVAA